MALVALETRHDPDSLQIQKLLEHDAVDMGANGDPIRPADKLAVFGKQGVVVPITISAAALEFLGFDPRALRLSGPDLRCEQV